jgi:hypothetical protein
MQLTGLVHETLFRVLDWRPGLGLELDDHVVPFHESTSVFNSFSGLELSLKPTASQLLERLQETPSRRPALGPGTIDHDDPFQDSISALVPQPTATQSVEPVHETPWSSLSELLWSGLGVMDHSVPFHDSTSV